jgi:hypothetical protein
MGTMKLSLIAPVAPIAVHGWVMNWFLEDLGRISPKNKKTPHYRGVFILEKFDLP